MAITQRTKVPAKSKADGSKTTTSLSAARSPSTDSVATRAYEIWRESGCAHGNDKAHWFRAEQELHARATQR